MDSGITVAALVAVNSFGSVIDPSSGRPWEIGREVAAEFGHQGRRSVKLPSETMTAPVRNTTLGVIATDATLTKLQAQKVAQMAHDGMARAIRPCHTMFDGDTIFCLATRKKQLPENIGFFTEPQAQALTDIGQGAADCISRAVIHGILRARSVGDMTAFCDLKDR
jgi:L-aminopeptidase/D-esterase-like protein